MKKAFLIIFACLLTIVSKAQGTNKENTFTAKSVEGVEITYKVISEEKKTCQVGNDVKTAIIQETVGMVTIPKEVKGFTVTAIGKYAFSYTNLTTVIIPGTVNSIGNSAFEGCRSISHLTLPKSVKSIGFNAFNFMHSPVAITSLIEKPFATEADFGSVRLIVPKGAKELYESTSGWNSARLIVELMDTNETPDSEIALLKDGDVFTAKTVEGVTMAFQIISASQKTCKVGAYVKTSDFVQADDVVRSCVPKYTQGKVTVPSEIKGFKINELSAYAFYDCAQLTEIVLSEGISNIGYGAFYNCLSLNTVRLPESLTQMSGNSIFRGSGITSLYIPRRVSYLGYGLFSSCRKLTSVEIDPDNYSFVGGCNAIISRYNMELHSACPTTTLPDGLKRIGYMSFTCVPGIKDLILPESVESIGTIAFNGTGIESIVLPKSLTSIETQSFRDCSSLKKVTYYNPNPPALESSTFTSSPTLYVPQGAIETFKATEGWKDQFGKILEIGQAETDNQQGDFNNDQEVNVTDVVTLISYIAKNDFSSVDKDSLDLNGDGNVDVTDVVTLILMIGNAK